MNQEQKITRIDLYQTPDGLLSVKYLDGWTANSQPASRSTSANWTLDQAIAWCEENGWIVRRWPGGARAFRGKMQPVRTRQQMIAKRAKMWDNRHLYPELQIHALDFAFDM